MGPTTSHFGCQDDQTGPPPLTKEFRARGFFRPACCLQSHSARGCQRDNPSATCIQLVEGSQISDEPGVRLPPCTPEQPPIPLENLGFPKPRDGGHKCQEGGHIGRCARSTEVGEKRCLHNHTRKSCGDTGRPAVTRDVANHAWAQWGLNHNPALAASQPGPSTVECPQSTFRHLKVPLFDHVDAISPTGPATRDLTVDVKLKPPNENGSCDTS